jgi:hypothetical protein
MLQDWHYKRTVLRRVSFLEELAPRLLALGERGVDVSPFASEFGVRLLDAVGAVENPNLRERWLRLVESAAEDPTLQQPILVRVLADLSGRDALVFERICQEADSLGIKGPIDSGSHPAWGTDPPTDPSEVTLVAVGLVEYGGGFRKDGRIQPVPSALGWMLRKATDQPASDSR